MAQEKVASEEKGAKTKEKVAVANPAQLLEESSDILIEYGGFELFEGAIDGVKALNPESKARKNIFLNEDGKKEDREKLKGTLQAWFDIINDSENLSTAIETAETKALGAESLLNGNLSKAIDASKDLEQAYRSISLFYNNTEQDKLRNVTIFNANMDRLKDLDVTTIIDKIDGELKQHHDRLDLQENYSILVIPGYLGSRKVVDKWAKIAYKNKVMLITDFQHLDKPDDVIEDFDTAKLTGSEIERSNVIMTCNWLKGRDKYEELNEEDNLYVPPSAALAGKIYNTLIAQPTAGKIHGGINDVDSVKFDLKKSEISELEKRGLIPMVDEWGKVMAFSAKTLYNGNDIGLQTYSVVRVFDFIGKVIIDYLNRTAFVNWTTKVERDLAKELGRYLDSIKGYDKIIESFKIVDLRQDKETKRIHLDIHITPFFPAKNFLLKLGGTKGDTAEEWEAEFNEL